MAVAVKRSLVWMALSQIVAFALQFVSSVIVARILTPYEFGVYGVGAATVYALTVIQSLGLGNLIIRDADLSHELKANIFTINGLLAVVLTFLIAGAAMLSNWFFTDPHVKGVLLIMSLGPLVSIFDIVPAAMLEREGNFRAVSISNTVRSGAIGILTVIFAMLGYRFIGLAIAQTLGIAITCVYLCIVGRQYNIVAFSLSRWRHVLGYGSQFLTLSSLVAISGKGIELSIARIVGLEALGFYNRASGLNFLLADKLRYTAERIVFTHLADQVRREQPIRGTYLYTVEMMSAVLWPTFAGLAVLSEPVIRIVYGVKWTGAAPILALLSVASMVQVSISLTWEIFMLRGSLKTQSKIEAIRSVIGFVIFVVACNFSLIAAAASRIVDALIANIMYRREIERMTETRLGDYLRIYGRSLVLTLLAIAPSAVTIATRGTGIGPIAIGLSVTGGVALWAGGLAALKHPLLGELSRPLAGLRARVQRAS